MKKVKPNQTYNMHEIGVVLKGYQINNAMENAWTTIHSYNDGNFKATTKRNGSFDITVYQGG